MQFVIHIPSTGERFSVDGQDRVSVFREARSRGILKECFRVLEFDNTELKAVDNYRWNPIKNGFVDPYA